MKAKKHISNSRRIFLVKFNESTELFIVQNRELFDLIKENTDMTLDFIKISDDYIPKFKRCKREVILNQFSWDTGVIEHFKKLSYFKGAILNGKKL